MSTRERRTVDVSVLVAVHAGVPADQLAAALASVAAQTVRPREVVVVVDGPVGPAHERVLGAGPQTHRVDLPARAGAGRAAAAGLACCTSTWVARADADDVSEPHRLEVQLARLAEEDADVCSAALTEFEGDPGRVRGVRGTPTDHADFARLMGRRNPVHQPAVVFRRACALAAGGYQHLPFLEDYDLWARMLARGARFTGCAEPLVGFRADGVLARRASPEARRGEAVLQRRLLGYGLIDRRRLVVNRAVRGGFLRLPAPLMRRAYDRVLLDYSTPRENAASRSWRE